MYETGFWITEISGIKNHEPGTGFVARCDATFIQSWVKYECEIHLEAFGKAGSIYTNLFAHLQIVYKCLTVYKSHIIPSRIDRKLNLTLLRVFCTFPMYQPVQKASEYPPYVVCLCPTFDGAASAWKSCCSNKSRVYFWQKQVGFPKSYIATPPLTQLGIWMWGCSPFLRSYIFIKTSSRKLFLNRTHVRLISLPHTPTHQERRKQLSKYEQVRDMPAYLDITSILI